MELNWLDVGVFLVFVSFVVGISLYKSRKEETGEDYFLAGRNLTWPLIGFSLIASNISTEHFVGMSGQGAGDVGLAIASYEWMAAITLVVVGIFFLPKFLKTGIYTIPEYLEYRYNATARAIMSLFVMIIYVFVSIAAVLYTGGLAIKTIFGLNLYVVIFLIGVIAATYTIYGGLKAVVWADLIHGAALLLGGAVVMVLGFREVGGVGSFFEANADKLHMFLTKEHPGYEVLPWTALIVGLWIPNFYYWGLNQFITQRTLGAKNLKQGQEGVMFAAFLKLLIPFIVVFPGIMAVQLYGDQIEKADQAYPMLMRNLLPHGLLGLMFAAMFGAIMSSLDSMLNSASTIFTMDLYKRHFRKDASPKKVVLTGRIATAIFVVVGCVVACFLERFPAGIFTYIQEFQGFISPGVLAAFVFGFVIKRAPGVAGVAALIINVIVYGLLLVCYSGYELFNSVGVTIGEIAFLNRMAITFGVLILVMTIITLVKPLPEPKVITKTSNIDLTSSAVAKIFGGIVIAATVVLYIIFR